MFFYFLISKYIDSEFTPKKKIVDVSLSSFFLEGEMSMEMVEIGYGFPLRRRLEEEEKCVTNNMCRVHCRWCVVEIFFDIYLILLLCFVQDSVIYLIQLGGSYI